MDYRIISADCHIDMTWMPGDLWVKNAPAKWSDQVPQVRESSDGPAGTRKTRSWRLRRLGFGSDRVQRGLLEARREDVRSRLLRGRPAPHDARAAAQDQVLDGVDAEVMYASSGSASGCATRS